MESRQGRSRARGFLPNSVDHLGRAIDPRVFRIAEEIAPRAVHYGERLLGDPAVALTLFEEVAANVSRALEQKATSGGSHVREMRPYLFRAYLRRISAVRKKNPSLRCGTEPHLQRQSRDAESRKIETRVLVRELSDCCDKVTQTILQRRLEGCSWKQIEQQCGMSANAAALRLRRVLRQFQQSSATTTKSAELGCVPPNRQAGKTATCLTVTQLRVADRHLLRAS